MRRIALGLTMLCVSVAHADGQRQPSLSVGIGYVNQGLIWGSLSSRSAYVLELRSDYRRERLSIGLTLTGEFARRILTVPGAMVGELDRFRGAWAVGYRLSRDYRLEFTHYSDHAQNDLYGSFARIRQENRVMLWRRF